MKNPLYSCLLMLAVVGVAATGCDRHPKPSGSASATPQAGLPPAGKGGAGRPDFAVDAVQTQEGKALWYDVPDSSLAARRAWPEEMTAASDRLPQNTYVRVTRLDPDQGRSLPPVVVRITDKSLGRRDALIEVDKDAAQALAMVKDGTARVRVETLALKNATADKPVEKKNEPAVASKVSEITNKPTVSADAEKDAAQNKTGEKDGH